MKYFGVVEIELVQLECSLCFLSTIPVRKIPIRTNVSSVHDRRIIVTFGVSLHFQFQ